jgi:hypothetical protein
MKFLRPLLGFIKLDRQKNEDGRNFCRFKTQLKTCYYTQKVEKCRKGAQKWTRHISTLKTGTQMFLETLVFRLVTI